MNGQIGKPGCKGPAKKMLNCKEKPCGDPVKPESVGPEGACNSWWSNYIYKIHT